MKLIVPDEIILSKIYFIRGKKVMIDRDLAELFGVETKRLKETVKRNKNRFPVDFMFIMNKEELTKWRSQNATSISDKMGLRHYPFCFTEQGVTMLSCILNSQRAIEVNIRVIRIFSKMREFLLDNREIRLTVELLEKRLDDTDEQVQSIFQALRQLLESPAGERTRIGYRFDSDKD
jgi:phage regulator Rha-like protein